MKVMRINGAALLSKVSIEGAGPKSVSEAPSVFKAGTACAAYDKGSTTTDCHSFATSTRTILSSTGVAGIGLKLTDGQLATKSATTLPNCTTVPGTKIG